MRYGILEDGPVYWVIDNIAEEYLDGPFLWLWQAEAALHERTESENSSST